MCTYDGLMRRLLAIGSSAVLVLGLAIGVTPAASAADLGTVTVTYNPGPRDYSVIPSVLSGLGGDTFTLRNTMISVNAWVSLVNSSGSVTLGGVNCAADASCRVIDAGGTATGLFTVTTPGTIAVRRTLDNGSTYSTIGTLTINAGGSGSAATDPALVYPTASIDANGGTCQGPTQYIKYQGQNASSGTFTAPTAASCTRTNFSLAGWARSATGSVEWQSGSTVTIGGEGFTLFAVWRPNGIEIVYDANVGLGTQCLSSNGTNVTTAAERRTTPTVVPASSAAAAQAPCTPPGHTLNGWSLTGAGPLTLVKGAALPASFTGTSQTLYAKWEPDRFDLSVQAGSLIVNSAEQLRMVKICAGVSQLVTFTATKNGVAAAGQIIDVQTLLPGKPPTTQKLTTDDLGRVQVSITLDPNFAPLVVNGSFVNQVANLVFNARDSLQCVTKSITITGSRGTVAGKPGIIVDGTTTGFKKGDTVVPYIRFPGETTFTQGSARPEIGDDGFFSWSRKTGKKIYVYVTSADGKVTSNRVIISAN